MSVRAGEMSAGPVSQQGQRREQLQSGVGLNRLFSF